MFDDDFPSSLSFHDDFPGTLNSYFRLIYFQNKIATIRVPTYNENCFPFIFNLSAKCILKKGDTIVKKQFVDLENSLTTQRFLAFFYLLVGWGILIPDC